MFPSNGNASMKEQPLLIVDDDPLICRMFQNYFARQRQVLVAYNGEEAIKILEKEPVIAILSDQMMPGMTGVEVLEASLKLRPEAVRILVTAGDRLENIQEAVNVARIHRFLVKPVRMLELESAVEGAIREVQLEAENRRLVEELQGKNTMLERALSAVQDHERRLEMEVEKATTELRAAVDKLSALALRDGLTGLYNHRFFQEALTTELARAGRHGRKAGLLFIDLDHFKNYNDLIGHPAGDEILRDLARILVNTQETEEMPFRGRISDIAARYGGEEFVIILPETDRAGALVRAERLRLCVEQFRFPQGEVQPGGRVTVSIGVAAYPEDALTKRELIEAADQALRRAKREGRNRVYSAQVVRSEASQT
jgi:diguanylate cyclase (GGDEF)-like protein